LFHQITALPAQRPANRLLLFQQALLDNITLKIAVFA
jgi:hypothetical protein